MQTIGHVVVVAPDGPQSGMGHAITIGKPLRLDKVDLYEGVEMYKCSGTPVDCVKLAVNKVFKGKKPDLCVSGINHGLNNSINVLYSGTMSAAVEGAIESIPSIGFSFDDFSNEADFSNCTKYSKKSPFLLLRNFTAGRYQGGISRNRHEPVQHLQSDL
jgi:5'-nucleotidase